MYRSRRPGLIATIEILEPQFGTVSSFGPIIRRRPDLHSHSGEELGRSGFAISWTRAFCEHLPPTRCRHGRSRPRLRVRLCSTQPGWAARRPHGQRGTHALLISPSRVLRWTRMFTPTTQHRLSPVSDTMRARHRLWKRDKRQSVS
jgi:hypothetical protein